MGWMGSYHNIPKAIFYLPKGNYIANKVLCYHYSIKALLRWSIHR